MTKRITVSLPDDVAAYLEHEENASAAVADAVRARMERGKAIAATLRAAGYNLTDEGIAAARDKLPPMPEDLKAEIQRRWEMIKNGTWGTDETGEKL